MPSVDAHAQAHAQAHARLCPELSIKRVSSLPNCFQNKARGRTRARPKTHMHKHTQRLRLRLRLEHPGVDALQLALAAAFDVLGHEVVRLQSFAVWTDDDLSRPVERRRSALVVELVGLELVGARDRRLDERSLQLGVDRAIANVQPEACQMTVQLLRCQLRDLSAALLEADVALPVVKAFIQQVRTRAVGQEVSKALNPGQQFLKIVESEMVAVMGEANETLNLAAKP